MTERPRPATAPRPYQRHRRAVRPRTYQRRRLAVLAGVLAAVLAAAPFLEQTDAPEQVATTADAGEEQRVRIAGLGSPTAVRELLSETTTTLVEATGATTTTTAPPTTVPPTTAASETAAAPTTVPPTTAAPNTTTTAAPTSTTTAPAPTTTAAPRSAAPPTTAAPTTTTAPPRTTTTTTAPRAEREDDSYAYDDPRSTQVWYDLAQCEAAGNWSINTGNGYYGGLQFALASWESVGGTGYPHEHPAQEQIERGRLLQARQGWGAWPHCSEKLGLR